MTPAWIDLEEMVNLRDIGGLPTRDGRRTQPGVLLRGENPDVLCEADVSHLVEVLGVRLVVDLRMPMEREGRASPLLAAGVEVLAFPMYEDPRKQIGPTSTAKSEADGARVMAEYYLRVIDSFQDRAVELLNRIVDGGVPALIHCAAGKDRTGMVVALLLGAADVEADAIVADYAATELRLERLLERLARTETPGMSDPYPRHVLRAHPDTMRVVVDTLVQRHGDLRQWWQAAGASDDLLDTWHRTIVGDISPERPSTIASA